MDITPKDELANLTDPSLFPEQEWKDDVTIWPAMKLESIKDYLLATPAIDGLPNAAHLSMEAVDLLMSGWVDKLLIKEGENGVVFVKGKVARSQSTTESEHTAWVCCNNTGRVLLGFCSCMAGRGRVCSHVSAILFKILEANKKGLNNVSCTDLPMQWNASTRRHVFPEKIKNIHKGKHFDNKEIGVISPTKKYSQFDSHSDLSESLNTSRYSKLFALKGSLWNEILSSSLQNNNVMPSENELLVHVNHDSMELLMNPVTALPSCEPCKAFFVKYVQMTDLQISELQRKTVDQSRNELWMDSRKIRITGSSASKCPKRASTNSEKFLKSHVYNTFRGNNNTEHGVVNKPNAIKDFENIFSFTVCRSGTVVSKDDVWLSASPDGFVGQDAIIEVKCPVKDIQELISGRKYDVRRSSDGTLYLASQGQNGYFLQCQLTMHCTNRHTCYFFVWGKPKPELIIVKYDSEYVHKEITRLRQFYFKSMLPYLARRFDDEQLLFGRSFMKLMQSAQL